MTPKNQKRIDDARARLDRRNQKNQASAAKRKAREQARQLLVELDTAAS